MNILLIDNKAFLNDSFKRHFERSVSFKPVCFDTFESFSQIIWHFSQYSQILTPPRWWGGGRVYTVLDVANRMINQGWTFEDLVSGTPKGIYKSAWFESCLEIEKGFDWDKCLPLMLLKPEFVHRIDCPFSRYRLIDGIHRTLVITYLVLKGQLSYRPVDGILMCYE